MSWIPESPMPPELKNKVDFRDVNFRSLIDNHENFLHHRNRLQELGEGAVKTPLKVRYSFSFVLPQPQVALPGSRPLPPFAHLTDIPLTVRLERRFKGNLQDLVWLCTVDHDTLKDSKDIRVIVKFIQPSMLRIPDSWHTYSIDKRSEPYIAPSNLVISEQTAYDKLVSLQGGIVPRFYGAHKVIMPNDEVATMLIIEYVEGITPKKFKEPHDIDTWQSEHHEKHIAKLQKGLVAAQRALAKIHASGVLHSDLNSDNIIIIPSTTSHDAVSVTFINFGQSMWQEGSAADWAQASGKKLLFWTDVEILTRRFAHCCQTHDAVIKSWIARGGPGVCVGTKDTAGTGTDEVILMPIGAEDTTGIPEYIPRMVAIRE
ncbi:hypothetical protein OF83DRAFT_682238 [Amylostereum chailletii]|nr:hypothetical protein OF83DRAFT_682238 [Amylostereum chailletii]